MIIYEVNLNVQWSIADAYRAWLAGHVDAMLALPGFIDAQRFDVLDSTGQSECAQFCVQYRLRDAAALDAYLATQASAMRAEAVERFGQAFTATRRVMLPVAPPAAID